MIFIAIKHWIFELCINAIFDKITTNFSIIDREKEEILSEYFDLFNAYHRYFNDVEYTYEEYVYYFKDKNKYDVIGEVCAMEISLDLDR